MSVQRAHSIQFAHLAACAFACSFFSIARAFNGHTYALDTEYSSANFFDGWDFFTGNDPTGGFVTYYSRSSAQLAGLVNSSDTAPTYIGADFVNELPVTSDGQAAGAGRPSVRISSKRSWTRGLFIGDFNHAPSGICGTWPAFWTLGPNWPYTGEVDIMEGVNKLSSNVVSLHTNETCIITSNSTTQLGILSNTNCAYYPGYNVGCGVVDSRLSSYSDFNAVGGGVYAMQWTSEYIRVWFWPRHRIPQDITNRSPDPSSWGLPSADLRGNCTIDQHFQQHKIIFDNTFCGEYAGNPYVWNSTINSCAQGTGYATCDAYVAENPAIFQDAYWSINSVRVYQLVEQNSTAPQPQYIASLQPANTANEVSPTSVSPLQPTSSLCPNYNFTIISDGGLQYEIECNYDPPGPDLPPPYANYPIHSFEDCVAGCTYWNTVNGTNLCGAVAYDASIPFCYFKKYIDHQPTYRSGFAGARLIYYGYPQITDDPRSQTASSTLVYVETIPTPQYYRPLVTSSTESSVTRSYNTTSISIETIPPPLGTSTNETVRPTVDPGSPTVNFSGTVSLPLSDSVTSSLITTDSSSYSRATTTRASESQSVVSSIGTASPSSTTTVSITTSTVSIPNEPTSSSRSTMSTSESLGLPSSSSLGASDTVSKTTTGAIGFLGPTQLGDYVYAGCKGSRDHFRGFSLLDSSTKMTIERCLGRCGSSLFAGIHERNCYCSNSTLSGDTLLPHPDSSCSITCPGNSLERCGGTLPFEAVNASISRRQEESFNNVNQVLLTLFNNTALTSQGPTLQQSSTSRVSISYSITATDTVTVTAISTTWCDYCSSCPNYETTLATTITVPCAIAQGTSSGPQPPTVPMMTTTRACNCGQAGAATVTTVTIPCETEIASLTRSATQVMAAAQVTSSSPYNAQSEFDSGIGVNVNQETSDLASSYSTISAVSYFDTSSDIQTAHTTPQVVIESTLLSQQQATVSGSVSLSLVYSSSLVSSDVYANYTAAAAPSTVAVIPLPTYTGTAVRETLKQNLRSRMVVWGLTLIYFGIYHF